MNEESLVKILMILGAVLFVLMNSIDLFFSSEYKKLRGKMLPQILCKKDESGNYVLQKSFPEVCDEIEEMKDYLDEKSCEVLEGEKMVACKRIVNLTREIRLGCWRWLLEREEVSINTSEIAELCDILRGE